MKLSSLAQIFALPTLVLLTGCSSLSSNTADQCQQMQYAGKRMEPYADTARKFRLCLPKGLTKSEPAGLPDDSVTFSGFTVRPGTTLQAKTLIIVPGDYDELTNATPFGRLAAGGVTFQRVKVDEGSAGHSTLHVIYIWARRGQAVNFDFTLLSVDPLNFDPANRPPAYNQAAQIKLTEEVMSTFTRLD